MTLNAAPGHLIVQRSPVDTSQEELPSGLIVEHSADESDVHQLDQGVVIDVGEFKDFSGHETFDDFRSGTVVYYNRSVKIRDMDVVKLFDVFAYEND